MIKVSLDDQQVWEFGRQLIHRERLDGAHAYASDFYGPQAAKVCVQCEEWPDDDGGDSQFLAVEVYDAQGKELRPDPAAPGWVDPECIESLYGFRETVAQWAQQWQELCADPDYAREDPLPEGWQAFKENDWIRLWVELNPEEARECLGYIWHEYLSCHAAEYELTADDLPQFALVTWTAGDSPRSAAAALAAALRKAPQATVRTGGPHDDSRA